MNLGKKISFRPSFNDWSNNLILNREESLLYLLFLSCTMQRGNTFLTVKDGIQNVTIYVLGPLHNVFLKINFNERITLCS